MPIVEAVVSFLAQNLGDPLIQEASLLYGVHDEFEWLLTEFRRMDCFLKESDTASEENELVKNWRREVRDVAYDAEDVIDTFILKVTPARRGGFMGTIQRYASIIKELKARREVASEIEWIKNKLRSITESRSTYGIGHITGHGEGTRSTGQSLQERMLPSPDFPEPDFVGFENDLKTLVKLLIAGEQRLYVVSIVGMGGLGKTTLAKKIYNHVDVRKQFDSFAWISVSQQFGVRDLLQAIIKSSMGLSKEDLESVEKMGANESRQKISGSLQGRRYLIVLDDIWSPTAWDAFKDAFPNNNNGSRILLTTRNKDVALHADALRKPQELPYLNEQESWNLFCRKVSLDLDHHDLKAVAQEIVHVCHGLPLAIVVIGGLLSRKEPREWNNVLKGIRWQFVKGEAQISGILLLSYKDLPYQLKPCFLYLGVFPEDHEFSAEKLIRLWAAEGLLEQRGDETLEEVGEDCLKELVQRSLIQIAERSSTGGIKSCRIHDLLRDLSLSEAKEDKFLEIYQRNITAPAASQVRRLAVHSDLSELPSLKSSSPHLRSLFHFPFDKSVYVGQNMKSVSRSFKLLRVLDLENCYGRKLLSEISALIHLKYLACATAKLPSSLGNLYNLQTLIIATNRLPLYIPTSIEKMQHLRHLQVKSAERLQFKSVRHFPMSAVEVQKCCGRLEHLQLDRLSSLQTLTGIKANCWICSHLGKLTNLRKLKIYLCFHEASEESYTFLFKLDSLRSLSLRASSSITSNLVPLAHLFHLRKLLLDVELEKLPDFPRNLTKLTLIHTYLKEDPLKTLEQLKNLQILRLWLNSYIGEEMLCSEQGFPQLKALYVEQLPILKEWKVEKTSMPSLLSLRIDRCWCLNKLPEGLEHVTTLKTLEVWHFTDELAARLRENEGEDWHKIQNISSIDITKQRR